MKKYASESPPRRPRPIDEGVGLGPFIDDVRLARRLRRRPKLTAGQYRERQAAAYVTATGQRKDPRS